MPPPVFPEVRRLFPQILPLGLPVLPDGRQSASASLVVLNHAQTPERILAPKHLSGDDLARCEELGKAFAAGLALGIF